MKEGKTIEEIGGMFDRIAWRYDFLNHLLSFGIDKIWRRRAVAAIAAICKPSYVLDIATGTADLAIALLRLNPVKVTGTDISSAMLERAGRKIRKRGLENAIELYRAAAESLPFPDNSFDLVMSAFGIRNLADTESGLAEMYRVVREGGALMILEFSRPAGALLRVLFGFYFNRVLPLLGRIVSGVRHAYTYLPRSVASFPEGEEFVALLTAAGFSSLSMKRLSGGIATIYTGKKQITQ